MRSLKVCQRIVSVSINSPYRVVCVCYAKYLVFIRKLKIKINFQMDVIATIICFIFLITHGVNMDEMGLADEQNTFTSVEAKKEEITIDVLRNQFNLILVELCASEIDRQKAKSAILKLDQLANSNALIENVVEYYIENYENFDNLLHFINQIPSLETEQRAYNTIVEAMKSNRTNVNDWLIFEKYIRTKIELLDEDHSEGNTYENTRLTVRNHINEFIKSLEDLDTLAALVDNSTNPDPIFDLIPTIVQRIDLNNFTDMDEIFKFAMQLPKEKQVQLIRKVLYEMHQQHQYKHVFHVITQIKKISKCVQREAWELEWECKTPVKGAEWTRHDRFLFRELQELVPKELEKLLPDKATHSIKFYNSGDGVEANVAYASSDTRYNYLYSIDLPKYSKNVLFVFDRDDSWSFSGHNYNSVTIGNYDNDQYLSVDYCYHKD